MFRATLLLSALGPLVAHAWPTDKVVKATATVSKPDADGKETVTITLTIDPKYQIYANPVGHEDLESNQVVASFKNAVASKITYPLGEVVKDKVVGDFNIYRKSVTITAVVKRTIPDDPIDARIYVQDSSRVCLRFSILQLSVK